MSGDRTRQRVQAHAERKANTMFNKTVRDRRRHAKRHTWVPLASAQRHWPVPDRSYKSYIGGPRYGMGAGVSHAAISVAAAWLEMEKALTPRAFEIERELDRRLRRQGA